MAREGIAEERYLEAFEALIDNGTSPDMITANMLQNAVGAGRYKRAAEFLEIFKERIAQNAAKLEKLPKMEAWFSDFVTQLTEHTRSMAAREWIQLSVKLEEHRAMISSEYDEKEAAINKKLEKAGNELAGATLTINGLEDQLERTIAQLQQANKEIGAINADKARLEEANSNTRRRVDELQLRLQEASHDKDLANQQRDELAGKLDAGYQEINDLSRVIADRNDQITQLSSNLAQAVAEKSDTGKKYTEAMDKYQNESMALRKAESKLEERNLEISRMEGHMEASAEKVRTAAMEADVAIMGQNKLKEEIDILKTGNAVLASDNTHLKEQIDQARSLTEENQRLHNSTGILEGRIQELQKQWDVSPTNRKTEEAAAEEKKKPGKPAKK